MTFLLADFFLKFHIVRSTKEKSRFRWEPNNNKILKEKKNWIECKTFYLFIYWLATFFSPFFSRRIRGISFQKLNSLFFCLFYSHSFYALLVTSNFTPTRPNPESSFSFLFFSFSRLCRFFSVLLNALARLNFHTPATLDIAIDSQTYYPTAICHIQPNSKI